MKSTMKISQKMCLTPILGPTYGRFPCKIAHKQLLGMKNGFRRDSKGVFSGWFERMGLCLPHLSWDLGHTPPNTCRAWTSYGFRMILTYFNMFLDVFRCFQLISHRLRMLRGQK